MEKYDTGLHTEYKPINFIKYVAIIGVIAIVITFFVIMIRNDNTIYCESKTEYDNYNYRVYYDRNDNAKRIVATVYIDLNEVEESKKENPEALVKEEIAAINEAYPEMKVSYRMDETNITITYELTPESKDFDSEFREAFENNKTEFLAIKDDDKYVTCK